eukprot:CAMPEP_0181132408 /NCGR_PEP_ID=MMETSP1071-20121207/30977_1 /TAXON_ID=35127 /ORGANISM="Thalassiosira sp., Strain NH16" /LENGTH=101 /DNA_ID=CAMNT_0023218735 /DNA_START=143 /DNA_END=445 /DNA_ORIENTATION=+
MTETPNLQLREPQISPLNCASKLRPTHQHQLDDGHDIIIPRLADADADANGTKHPCMIISASPRVVVCAFISAAISAIVVFRWSAFAASLVDEIVGARVLC